MEDALGLVLQLGLALLEPLISTGGRGGTQHITQAQLPVPAAQPLQALLLLVQLGQGQLGLGDLLVDLGQILAALGQPAGTMASPPAASTSWTARVMPSAKAGASGTSQADCPTDTAPVRRSSRHTATRWRDGSAGTRNSNTIHSTP